ncbi:carboxypeptidase-like regulatory domain-containing protein [Puia sp. P3]|uniref:carboxypeptidase-like regulatory domain-containing protein n=1 Tax=Puia sp. P3 TaxID=3423952 RepID=UPI003D66A8A6
MSSALRHLHSCLAGIIVLSAVLAGYGAFAQAPHTVRGIVFDSQKNPVEGASVMVKATTTATRTDGTGRFSILVPADKHILVISHIGKAIQEVSVHKDGYISVSMKDSTATLDDVVIVGYGRQKKESVVGAIAQVKGDVLEKRVACRVWVLL